MAYGSKSTRLKTEVPMSIQFTSVVPILRIFDIEKAEEFYEGFLGFKVDWEHRFNDNAPLYRQVSRGGLALHLSEHHGDGCPGARLRVMMHGAIAPVSNVPHGVLSEGRIMRPTPRATAMG